MSKHHVVAEYLAGRIDRREFIVKLTTAGVSTAAAIAYAETFSQSVSARGAGKDARGYVTAFQGTADYPVLDTDDDGFTDDEEADCGSDPNDPNSTCDNVGGGGGLGAVQITVTVLADLTINLPGGASIVLGAGSTIVISVGTAVAGGLQVTMTFNGTINGQPASFTASVIITSGVAAVVGGLRALATGTPVSLTIDSFSNWDVPGVDEPSTPLHITVSGTGGVVTVDVEGASSTISISSTGTNQFGIAPVNGLPNTGVGSGDGSEREWLAPVAALGVGLGLLSRKIRGAKQSS